MKIGILMYYFFRSLVLRGPFRHFQLLLAEGFFERKFGLHTTGFKTSASRDFYHYQAAAYIVLLRILKEVGPYTSEFSFYDIGCGKGRALYMAALSGYKKVIGIELDVNLLNEAKRNLNTVRLKNKRLNVEFYAENCLEHLFKEEAAVYFLFNPFSAEVMRAFIDRVMRLNTQPCYFVYMNPKFAAVFAEKKIPIHKIIRSFLYTEAIIYKLPNR